MIILNKSSVIEKFFWKRLVLHKVNNFGGVPYIYEIISKVGLKSENYKFIKYIFYMLNENPFKIKKSLGLASV